MTKNQLRGEITSRTLGPCGPELVTGRLLGLFAVLVFIVGCRDTNPQRDHVRDSTIGSVEIPKQVEVDERIDAADAKFVYNETRKMVKELDWNNIVAVEFFWGGKRIVVRTALSPDFGESYWFSRTGDSWQLESLSHWMR